MIKGRILTLFIITALCVQSIFSVEVKKIGTVSAAFLNIPVGTRAISMGGAFVSVADDGSAIYWNPGSIANFSNKSLYFYHSPWLSILDFSYASAIVPLGRYGVIGLNGTVLRSGDIEITTYNNQWGTGETYSATFSSAGFAYAMRLTDRFSIGANIKYINERIYNCSASNIAIDLGTLFKTPFDGIILGVSITNIGTAMRITGEDLNTFVDVAPTIEGNNDNIVAELKTDYFDLPTTMKIGISWQKILFGSNRFQVAIEGVNPNFNSQYLNVGIGFYLFNGIINLSAGNNELFLENSEKGRAVGINIDLTGLSRYGIKIGYSFQYMKHLPDVEGLSIEFLIK